MSHNVPTAGINSLDEKGKYDCNYSNSIFTTESNLTTHIKSVYEGVEHYYNLHDNIYSAGSCYYTKKLVQNGINTFLVS